jgi:N-acetylglutamate synthase-like GNAT family acetyltransferase
MVTLRAWADPQDTTAMQRLASKLWPAGLHPGGLGWAVAIEQLGEQIVLAERDDNVVGWASLFPCEAQVAADPSAAGAAPALVDWVAASASGSELTLPVAVRDDAVRAAAIDAGFARKTDAQPGLGMLHPADPVRASLPSGYIIRSVEDGEQAARVECHREAWLPRVFPWPGERPQIPEDATSRFTARHYEQVRRTSMYDQTLDLVVVAPDGSFAGCCIVWYDPATRSAEIEPLGVVADHRRQGLAGALCLEAITEVARRGGREVFISSDPSVEYWVPSAAYAKVGFKPIERTVVYHLPK